MKLLSKLSCCGLVLFVLSGCGKSARVEKNLGPAETITYAANTITKNDVGALWTMLPKSYRSEINGIAHLIGAKVPDTLWDKVFTLVGRLGNVLESKKDIILQMMEGSLPPNTSKDDVKFGLESVGKMLSILANSDISKVEKLKSIDLTNVADGTLTDIMKILNNDRVKKIFESNSRTKGQIFFDSLTKVKAELVSQSGNTAKVKVTDPKGKVEELELVKVEDKWISKMMAESFKTGLNQMKSDLSKALESLPKQQAQISGALLLAEGVVTTLESAKTPDDFKNAFASLGSFGLNPMAMMSSLGSGRAKAMEAKEKLHLKQIGTGIAMHFTDGNSTSLDGTYAQFKDLKDLDFDINNYPLLFDKGHSYEGAADLPLACEKPDPSKDGVNVVFQDGHVEKVKGSFKTLDDVKKAIKAQGYRLKSE